MRIDINSGNNGGRNIKLKQAEFTDMSQLKKPNVSLNVAFNVTVWSQKML